MQEFSFDAADIVETEPEPAVSAPIEPSPAVEQSASPAPVEINFEPIAIDAPAPHAAAPEAAEIDISNEWEEMIEVEPEESPAPALEVQSYQEILAEPAMPAEIPAEPVISIEPEQPDISTQVADKIQEIRFYISQEMWDQAKAAILDLTELAPDAPEVTELIAQVSKGQAGVTPVAVEAAPIEIEEAPAAFAPIEVTEPFAAEPLPAAPVIEDRPVAAQPAPALDLENVLDIVEPPPKPKSAKAPPQPAAQAAGQSTEDILGDFLQDLERSDLADFAPKPTPSGTSANPSACDGSSFGPGHRQTL